MAGNNKKKKSRSRGSRKKKSEVVKGPPSSAQSYNGPYRLPKISSNMDTTVVEMSNLFTFSSSGGGAFANVIGNNLASFLDNTNFTAVWDEWRCLSMEAIYYPVLDGASFNGLAYQVAYGVIDNDNNAALTAATSAVDYASVKPFALDKKMVLKWKMDGTTDAAFLNNAGTATVWFKYYCTGLTASTTYGTAVVKALFQFRGRI